MSPAASDEALAAQIARRLCAEGAASATAEGAVITFAGTTQRQRPDLPAWHPLLLVSTGEVTVRRVGDRPRVTSRYRVAWHGRVVRAFGIGMLIPVAFITPNGPAAAAFGVAFLGVIAVRQVVARARFTRWLEQLLVQEESLLEHHARALGSPATGAGPPD